MELDDRTHERIADIISVIQSAIGSLDDLQFDLLREASSKKMERPVIDKTMTQARRALEKAAHLLDL